MDAWRRSRAAAATALWLPVMAACGADDQGAAGAGAAPRPLVTDVVRADVGGGPVGLVEDAGGRVWVANPERHAVQRLSKDLTRVDLTARTGGAPLRLAATDDAVWATVFDSGQLVRIDPATGELTDRVDVGESPEGVTVADGTVWVVLQNSGELVPVDPTSGTAGPALQVALGPRLVEPGDGVLFVSDYLAGEVLRVDPATGRATGSGDVCDGPQGMALDGDELVVACTNGNEVVVLDPTSLTPIRRLRVPGGPDAVTSEPQGQDPLVASQAGPVVSAAGSVDAATARPDWTIGRLDPLYDQANIDVLTTTDGRVVVSSYLGGEVVSGTTSAGGQ